MSEPPRPSDAAIIEALRTELSQALADKLQLRALAIDMQQRIAALEIDMQQRIAALEAVVASERTE